MCFPRDQKVTVLGPVSRSSCRHLRRSSSLRQGRNHSQETLSSMWLEPLTCSVSLTLFCQENGVALFDVLVFKAPEQDVSRSGCLRPNDSC